MRQQGSTGVFIIETKRQQLKQGSECPIHAPRIVAIHPRNWRGIWWFDAGALSAIAPRIPSKLPGKFVDVNLTEVYLLGRKCFLEDTMPFRFEWGPADTTPSSRAQFTLHLLGFHWLTLRRSETFRSCSAAEDHPRQTSDFENQMALNDDTAAKGICLN